jgi:DNA-binding NarL/FixJ family response regulator
VHLLSILEELLTGDTDVTMSRRLSMSPRTFSRRVAELLEYLGVNTRFQAGMQVALHGWVPLSACAPMIDESLRRNQPA